MVEILDGRLGKRSVQRVRYVINNLLHLVIVKYGVISLLLYISTRLRLVTILSLLVKYLDILHADTCNKSYICVSEYRKGDLKAQKIFLELLIPSYSLSFKISYTACLYLRGKRSYKRLSSAFSSVQF